MENHFTNYGPITTVEVRPGVLAAAHVKVESLEIHMPKNPNPIQCIALHKTMLTANIEPNPTPRVHEDGGYHIRWPVQYLMSNYFLTFNKRLFLSNDVYPFILVADSLTWQCIVLLHLRNFQEVA